MAKMLRTPMIKPRTQGGTFYTFPSALEDIGLNINEQSNKIAMSHYVLLDIPSFEGRGNLTGDEALAESFQNYALNLETIIRDSDVYDFSEKTTISERVFWKWMRHKFGLKFKTPVDDENTEIDTDYFVEDSSNFSTAIVKGFGTITSGSQRTDSYGIYNETYVQIPSSYGQMPVLFKKVKDYNYDPARISSYQGESTIHNVPSDENITGLSKNTEGDSGTSYTITEDDTMCVEFSLDKLQDYYENKDPKELEITSYDDLAIRYNTDVDSSFKFNAILLYYSIYDSTGKTILATNAYGLLLVNNSVAVDNGFKILELDKVKSSNTVSGSSYSFRVNTRTSTAYSGDITIIDESTGGYTLSEDFNNIVRNLSDAVSILVSNTKTMKIIASNESILKDMYGQVIEKLTDIETAQRNIITRITSIESRLNNEEQENVGMDL